jgi:hypothetical protein
MIPIMSSVHVLSVIGDDGELLEESRQLIAEKGWEGIGDNRLSSVVNPLPPNPNKPRL